MTRNKEARFELILGWPTGKQIYEYQKLGFKEKDSIRAAYKNARNMHKMIITVGGFTNKDCKLLAVSYAGVMQKLVKEEAIPFKANQKAMRKLIDNAQSLTDKSKPKHKKGASVIALRRN
jgi:hypothetical protein